jgi:hypothetical protein
MVNNHIFIIDLENFGNLNELKRQFYSIYKKNPTDTFDVYIYNKNVPFASEIKIKMAFRPWLKNDYLNNYNKGTKNSTDMVIAMSLLEKRRNNSHFYLFSKDRDFDPVISLFNKENIPIQRLTVTEELPPLEESLIFFRENKKTTLLTKEQKTNIITYFFKKHISELQVLQKQQQSNVNFFLKEIFSITKLNIKEEVPKLTDIEDKAYQELHSIFSLLTGYLKPLKKDDLKENDDKKIIFFDNISVNKEVKPLVKLTKKEKIIEKFSEMEKSIFLMKQKLLKIGVSNVHTRHPRAN